jgi:hypothetical protein
MRVSYIFHFFKLGLVCFGANVKREFEAGEFLSEEDTTLHWVVLVNENEEFFFSLRLGVFLTYFDEKISFFSLGR